MSDRTASDYKWAVDTMRRAGWDVVTGSGFRPWDIIVIAPDRAQDGTLCCAVVLRRRADTGSEEDHE